MSHTIAACTMNASGEYSRWGAELLKDGQPVDAALAFQQALRLDPHSAETHNALSVALRLQGRLDEAIAHGRQAVGLAPEMAEAHSNLGSMLQECGQVDEAIDSLREALRLRPTFASAHCNLGVALFRQRHYAEAVALYRQAIALDPQLVDAHNNLGSVLFELGECDESLRSFSEAIRLKPDFREAHWGRALVWLSQGDFDQGWPEFEWRPTLPMPGRGLPRWNGSELSGRTLLIEAEQGLGDTLQFVRYAAVARERGGRVVVACQPRLVRLLSTCCPAIDEVVTQGEVPTACDVHLPLLSTPGVVGTTLANVPAHVPYLFPEPRLAESWRRELSALRGCKVGIAWQGSPEQRGDRERSIRLAEFEPLAWVPGVRLVSLQKGPGIEQIGPARRRFEVIDFTARLDESAGPFMDTAAIMAGLDLVVSCDSAVCHLAGAMGVPVWVAASVSPDWRWLLNRNDSPWYPTMRLFRQSRLGRWSDVFENMAAALAGEGGLPR